MLFSLAGLLTAAEASAAPEASAGRPPKLTPEQIRAKLLRAQQIPVSAHFTMVGSGGAVFGPAANPEVASMAVGGRLSAGIFLSPRFALELDGGINCYSPGNDPETQTGPESVVFGASLALRWYPRPIHRQRAFHPYVTAGVGYQHLRLFIRQADGETSDRFTASGGSIHVGVGATTIIAAYFSLELRLVYRVFRFGTKHWKGPLVPVAKSCCSGTAGWGHLLAVEIGWGVLF